MSPDRAGMFAALGAYLTWGVFGLYFHALGALPAAEVMAHRILGAGLFAGLLIVVLGQGAETIAVVRDGARVRALAGSALAIAVNWGVFIWAVAQGHALDASLGYFLFPLVSVVLARLLLGERLTGRRLAAVGLAGLGVGGLVVGQGTFPWVALVLAFSFGAYGLLRKTIAVPALVGLLVETALLTPFALAYLVWAGGGQALGADASTLGLLAGVGPATAIPLILFAFGARRLRLGTLGMLMYVNPTTQMLVAVFSLGEAFTGAHQVAFGAIWAGLALYSWPERRAGLAKTADPP